MIKFLVCYTLFSIVWAFFEQFLFNEKNFHVGASNFLKINGSYRLVWQYHGPMALFFLTIPIVQGGWTFLFALSAVILEDMFYYVGNKFDKPDGTENITGCLGFIYSVPILWIAGFAYTTVVVYLTLL